MENSCITCFYGGLNELDDIICCCGDSDNCGEFMSVENSCEHYKIININILKDINYE